MDGCHSPAPELMRPPEFGPNGSVPQRHLSPRRRYAAKEWEAIKPFIKKSYIDNNETLSKLMRRLSEEHDFHPTSVLFTCHYFYESTSNPCEGQKCSRINSVFGILPKILPTRTRAVSSIKKRYLMPHTYRHWVFMEDR